MKLNELISKVYYLNMDKDINRKISIESTIESMKITKPIIRVSGVDCNDNIPNGYFNNRGHYGCRLGHINIAEKIRNDCDNGYVLIMEDDCAITDLYYSYIETVIEKVSQLDFDLFFLYPNGSKYKNKGPNLSKNCGYGTHAIILNTKNISTYIDVLKHHSLNNPKFVSQNCFNVVDVLLKFNTNLVKYKCDSTLITQNKQFISNTII